MNLFRKRETIFWLTFTSEPKGGKHQEGDRRWYFPGRKTLKELHDWVEEMRTLIEGSYDTKVVITNFGILER